MEIGNIFIGIGIMTLFFVMSWFVYQFVRIFQQYANIEEKYSLLEEFGLDKVAKKKEIDLNKEIIKRSILKNKGKSFRKRIEEEMFEEMFDKSKEE